MSRLKLSRAKLSKTQVINIFNTKKTLPSISAAKLSTLYGIGEKTVRDIWTGRTWSKETQHLKRARNPQKTGGQSKVTGSSMRPKAISVEKNLPFRDAPASLAGSVDQQLHEWDQAFWIDHEGDDPFHDDWNLW